MVTRAFSFLFYYSNERKYVFGVYRALEKNGKKIALETKNTLQIRKKGVSVLLRLFISSNKVCNTAYAL